MRRELAEAIENVFETFARTCGATREKPLEISRARLSTRLTPSRRGPRARNPRGRRQGAARVEGGMGQGDGGGGARFTTPTRKTKRPLPSRNAILALHSTRHCTNHGDWRENRGGWHPIAA